MFSAADAAARRSRSKSTRQISGGGSPSHSAAESESCMRYSDKCERRRIKGADSANCFSTVQVSSSRQTPTTDRGSLVEKLSRGEPLSASLIDIGFISHSEPADYPGYPWPLDSSPAGLCQKLGCSRT